LEEEVCSSFGELREGARFGFEDFQVVIELDRMPPLAESLARRATTALPSNTMISEVRSEMRIFLP